MVGQVVIFAENALANGDGLEIGGNGYGVAMVVAMVMINLVVVMMMGVGVGNGCHRTTAAILTHICYSDPPKG
ncbi:MAG: hypothetical protein RLZZ490_256 [Cyanobacteriota bacterium]